MLGEDRTQGGHVCDQNRSGCGDEDRRQHNAAALLGRNFDHLLCINCRDLSPDVSGPRLGLLCSLRLADGAPRLGLPLCVGGPRLATSGQTRFTFLNL